jgi:hypothetical protein
LIKLAIERLTEVKVFKVLTFKEIPDESELIEYPEASKVVTEKL